MPIASHSKHSVTSVLVAPALILYRVFFGTGITSLSCTIVQLDDAIAYFHNADDKRQHFKVIMALLMKRNSKERIIYCRLEWCAATFVCLKTVTLCLYVHAHVLTCWKLDLEITTSTVNRLAMFSVILYTVLACTIHVWFHLG